MRAVTMPYQHEEAGLHYGVMQRTECSTCGPVVVNDCDVCEGCGAEQGLDWSSADDAGFTAYISALNKGELRVGSEFNSGWEMFMLPKQGVDPERRTAYSVADFEQKLRKTNMNQDGVTTWDKKPPRYLSPDERSPW